MEDNNDAALQKERGPGAAHWLGHDETISDESLHIPLVHAEEMEVARGEAREEQRVG